MAALGASALLFAVFVSLGTWQVQRRSWKLDLITRVEQRAHAPAIEAPGPERWPLITNSDAHRLSEMQCSQQLVLQDSSIKSILKVWQLGSDTVQ